MFSNKYEPSTLGNGEEFTREAPIVPRSLPKCSALRPKDETRLSALGDFDSLRGSIDEVGLDESGVFRFFTCRCDESVVY
jgi:hypothetical protein